tara:strand:+ start:19 stop:3105 length:3087 start_codon:yes stop_codon:yes gene_type:complete
MSIRIQILDYNYSATDSPTNLISNGSFDSATDWDEGTGWNIAGGKATHTGGTGMAGYLNYTNVTFYQGQSYKIKGEISGRTTGSLKLLNDVQGVTYGFSQSSNGSFSYTWVQGSSNTDKLSLYGSQAFDGNVEYAFVYATSGIDFDKSILGELEVTSHSDFPLALTFQIGDIKDITSTSGDYSKTFKVPATKHNNKLLKHIYTPNVVPENNPTKFKKCRIIIDGAQTITGVIKVTGVGGYGETASYYDCLFFGNNMSWGKLLDEKYLNQLDLLPNSTGLTYDKDNIVATWQHANSDAASPIVYPVTSYGDFNPDGMTGSIQLLDYREDAAGGYGGKSYKGWDNSNNDFGTPNPVADWRPAVFVKTTLESIFSSVGYQISSTFMDTDMFKQLVWLLPNFQYSDPDDRYGLYGIDYKVVNLSTLTAPSTTNFSAISETGCWQMNVEIGENDYDPDCVSSCTDTYTGSNRQVIDLSLTKNMEKVLDNGSYMDMGADEVTVGEYGNYTIQLTGLQAKVARAYRDSANQGILYKVGCVVNLEVKTVGQTSWNIVNQATTELEPKTASGNSQTTWNNQELYSDYVNLTPFEEEKIFLNKGDKVRLTTGVKVIDSNTTSIDFKIYLFWKATTLSKFMISIDPIFVYYGQTFDLDKIINPKYKQLDFIKGVAHAFNLVMTTDVGSNIVYIEPFNDFYKTQANAVDWTYKLDRGREISDKWIPSELKKQLIFKYATDDNDDKVKHRGRTFFDNILDEYPYQEDLSDDFDKGESLFENPFFAGTYNATDRDTGGGSISPHTSVYSACLWKQKGDETQTSANDFSRPDKGNDFLPRLLYWNKLTGLDQQAPDVSYSASVQTWAHTTPRITANQNYSSGSTAALSYIYPQATSINRNDSTYPVLSYGNIWTRDYNASANTYSIYYIGKGLYETYYKGLFEQIKTSPRLRTAYVDLKQKDIVNLDFTKLIYIDGCYWRINKVVDYQPHKNTPTKVELIEWIEVGVFASKEPSYGSTGDITWGIPLDEAITVSGNENDNYSA